MQNFVDNFQVAKEKFIEAGAAAAEAARQNMHSVYQNATRIKLNFNIKAPVIIIPQNSQSSNVIVVDLGLLLVNNQLRSHDTVYSSSQAPIFDDLKVGLENLKILRSLFFWKVNSIRFQNYEIKLFIIFLGLKLIHLHTSLKLNAIF